MTHVKVSNHSVLNTIRQSQQDYVPTKQSSVITRISLKMSLSDLTRRELQCLQLSLRGQSARQAAAELGISQRTVEEYLNNAKKKLGVSSKREMIGLAINLLLER